MANYNLTNTAANIDTALQRANGVTAGTVGATKFVLVDSDKDISGFRDVSIDGDLSYQGTTQAGYQTTKINVIETNAPDNTDTQMGQMVINSYATNKTYDWALGFLFEGLILATDSSTTAVTSQIYKCSSNISKIIVNDNPTNDHQTVEVLEPTEANTDSASLRAYTTSMSVQNPEPEKVTFKIKCNITGTQTATSTIRIFGTFKVWSYLRNVTDSAYGTISVSKN